MLHDTASACLPKGASQAAVVCELPTELLTIFMKNYNQCQSVQRFDYHTIVNWHIYIKTIYAS